MNTQTLASAKAELARDGHVRVGINFGNALLTCRDATTGVPGGIAVDLAMELGRRLGADVEIVPYGSAGTMAKGAKSDEWDVAFLAAEPERSADIHFSPAYLEIEGTYLVPSGSSLRSIAEVDQDGVRIAVSDKSAYDLFLTRQVKRAQLVRAPNVEDSVKLFFDQGLEALSGLRPLLLQEAEKHPGARVLEGRFMLVRQASGTPAERTAGAQYLATFIEDMKASGVVAALIEKNGIRGVMVACSDGA